MQAVFFYLNEFKILRLILIDVQHCRLLLFIFFLPPHKQNKSTNPTNTTNYNLCKIKIGRIQRWKATYEEKSHQHDGIEQALKNEGWEVTVHTVIFGTAATIFTHSLDILLLLGVPRPAALTCLKKINIYAAQSAHAHLVRTLSTKPTERQHDPP